MSVQREGFNPFYALLIVLGIAFSVTACAYGVMMVRDMRAGTEPLPDSSLMTFLDEQGSKVLGIELALLAIATVGAIGTDGYWQRRAARRSSE